MAQIPNMDILSPTGFSPLADHIARRHTTTFGHIARLADDVPAQQALKCQVDTSIDPPSQFSTCRPMHPRIGGWINSVKTPSIPLSRSGDAQFVEVMVLERLCGPRRLHDFDDEMVIVFGCPCQCNRLPGKTRLRNNLLCVEWDVEPYTLVHSVFFIGCCEIG